MNMACSPNSDAPSGPLVRLVACGSVDDGKSTLIGRLLFETGATLEDEIAALERLRQARGDTQIDLALLVDGLIAEREQGITIDVAYRRFATPQRAFLIADAPGHEQYTRNMATAASNADLALALVDARSGVLDQTRRHLYLASLMGVREAILAINKMDLAAYEQATFDAIARDFAALAERLGFERAQAIPVSALHGENVSAPSRAMPWWTGPTLLDAMEATRAPEQAPAPLRMPVQWVARAADGFRGYAGRIVSGAVRAGETIALLPSGRRANVARIVTMDGDLKEARTGQSITLTFAEDVDCSRGDVVASASDPAEIADQFETTIIWMAEEEMLPGRTYWLKIGACTASAQITSVKHKIRADTLEAAPARRVGLNDIAVCNISLDRMIAFDPYRDNRDMGAFILIDRASNATLGAGLIHFALRRASNVHWQAMSIDRSARAANMGQKSAVLWFTGLSGAGKSAIADLVDKKLHSLGVRTALLDGDNIRHGLNRDLGFTDADRVENIRRVAEVARLMADAGLVVLVSFISPFRAEREMARALVPPGEFFEIFVDTPLAIAEARDVKGLYKKARSGLLKNFTGVDSPYEAPEAPEIRIDTTSMQPQEAAEHIVRRLRGA